MAYDYKLILADLLTGGNGRWPMWPYEIVVVACSGQDKSFELCVTK